ncbi:LacI family DNA-binding transcriptional regulator [Streptomyces sp. NPDC002164]|uniref:LacI family DNA-binding transcriptional regulator n=1 Tax=unclassified Streptomyces TaxID=2593676 RepID=UPI00367D3D92
MRSTDGLREVSRRAGVSVTTASHALDGVGRVGAETRQRVLAVAAEVGYRANPNARGLRGARTGLLGPTHRTAVEGGITDIEYFVKIVNAVTWTAMRTTTPSCSSRRPWTGAPSTRCRWTAPSSSTRSPTIRCSAASPAWASPSSPPGVTCPARTPSPGSTTSCPPAPSPPSTISPPPAPAARLLTGSTGQSYGEDAADAYRDWCGRTGRPVLMDRAESGTDSTAAAHGLPARPDRPDALYVVMEKFGFATLVVCRELGLGVPDDVQIVVGADGEFARSARPELTALDLAQEEIGRQAAELLIDVIRRPPPAGARPGHRLVPARLLPRASTRPVRTEH